VANLLGRCFRQVERSVSREGVEQDERVATPLDHCLRVAEKRVFQEDGGV
jgi:hypothetical protein